MFPKFNHEQIANIITDDKTLVYYLEQVKKNGNKLWLTFTVEGLQLLKEPQSQRMFISCDRIAAQISGCSSTAL